MTYRIGGSSIGAVVGVSRYRTPLDVWRQAVLGERQPETIAMAVGTALESLVARRWGESRGCVVTKPPNNTLHPSYPCAVGHLDGIATIEGERCGVEIKTVNERSFAAGDWGEPGTDRVPFDYFAQCAWYQGLSGLNTWYLVALVGTREIVEYRIDFRNLDVFRELYRRAEEFIAQHIEPKVPPEARDSREMADFLRKRWRSTVEARPATEAETALALKLRDVRLEVAEAEARKKALETELMGSIQDASGIQGPWGRIDWRHNRDTRVVDYRAVVAAMGAIPELAEKVAEATKAATTTKRGARPFCARFAGEKEKQDGE